MDVTPGHQDPATGDDELAKVLAGVSDDPQAQPQSQSSGLQFEETPAQGSPAPESPTPAAPVSHTISKAHEEQLPALVNPNLNTPPSMPTATAAPQGALDEVKRDALEELRPLVGKLNLPPEEKFDTLLLIIRSTDDQSLVTEAYQAAKAITDETKRAQALLDVIKEIDYFSSPPATSAIS